METPETPKPRPFHWLVRWKFWRRLLLVALTLVTLYALLHAEENWRGKKAWTEYMRRKTDEGISFNFAKCVPPTVPDHQNFAATPFLAPLFDFVPGTQHPRDTNATTKVFNAFNIANPVRNQMSKEGWLFGKPLDLVGLATNWIPSNQTASAALKPGQTREAAAALLHDTKPALPILEELREASRRPSSRFNIAYDTRLKFAILLPHLSVLKQALYVLQVRACSELTLGLKDEAAQDIQLMFRLTDAIRTEPFMISQLVRAAMLTADIQPIWEGTVRQQWSDQHLAGFVQELERLDFVADGTRSVMGERCAVELFMADLRNATQNQKVLTDSIDSSSDGGAARSFASIWPRGWWYFEDLNYQRLCDLETAGVVSADGIDPALAEKNMAQATSELGTNFFELFVHHAIIARMILPAYGNFEFKIARAQDQARLAIIACSLERYRLAKNEYPASLNDLAPAYVAKVPPDVIKGQSWRYHPGKNGDFILHSVAWDMKDDNGAFQDRPTADAKHLGATWPNYSETGDWTWPSPK